MRRDASAVSRRHHFAEHQRSRRPRTRKGNGNHDRQILRRLLEPQRSRVARPRRGRGRISARHDWPAQRSRPRKDDGMRRAQIVSRRIRHRTHDRRAAESLMRVALANCHRQVVGGAESYIKAVVLELESAGVEVALLTEVESAPDRERIELSAGAPAWSISEIGEQAGLDAMRAWRPDLVFVHLVESPALESCMLDAAT